MKVGVVPGYERSCLWRARLSNRRRIYQHFAEWPEVYSLRVHQVYGDPGSIRGRLNGDLQLHWFGWRDRHQPYGVIFTAPGVKMRHQIPCIEHPEFPG
jgi:hypothetical protein